MTPSSGDEREAADDAIIAELRTCTRCLYLEVPSVIAKDVEKRAEAVIAALSTLRAEQAKDTARLNWLDRQSWISVERTDESDNNGVGLTNMAVIARSTSPDGKRFPTQLAATFREAIDAARATLPETGTNA